MSRHSEHEPVTVLETNDPALIAVAKSILTAAEIPFFAKGEEMVTLIGQGFGPVEIQVSPEDAADAHAALIDLTRQTNDR